jgi:uncharacterized membrane protein
MPEPLPKRFSLFDWLRLSFLAGVAIVAPFAVTIWLILFVVGLVDRNIVPLAPSPLREALGVIPGAGILVGFVALVLLGALTGNFVGRMLVRDLEALIERLPIIRSIYGGTKQVFNQVATPERRSFQEAVLVEFPGPGLWSIAFVTNEAPDISAETDMVALYIPLAPLPTTGYLIYAKRADLKPLGMGTEEAMKRVLSLGAGPGPPTVAKTK